MVCQTLDLGGSVAGKRVQSLDTGGVVRRKTVKDGFGRIVLVWRRYLG